uniref:LAGLIDADG homing endonuclease n=1 Tax=Globodera rostochiensis TaxID=31243 RepID=A0A914HXH2_GLORO
MATKVGVNLSEIKPSKFKNRFELFKLMLQLFKYTNEKNHLMEKEMTKLFGFAKSFLQESSNSILNANKTKQRRHKRELATNNLSELFLLWYDLENRTGKNSVNCS